jgi:hypothetical protein
MKLLEIAKEVRGFWAKLFGNVTTPQAKPVAKKKEKPTLPLTKPKSWQTSLSASFTEFFKLQEQLAAHIREEEEKEQNSLRPRCQPDGSRLKEGHGSRPDGVAGD